MVCSKILSINCKSLPRGFLQTKTAKMLVATFQPLKQMLVESSMQCAHAHKQKTHTHTDTLNLQHSIYSKEKTLIQYNSDYSELIQ